MYSLVVVTITAYTSVGDGPGAKFNVTLVNSCKCTINVCGLFTCTCVVPSTPTNLQGIVSGSDTIHLTWNEPETSHGPLLRYIVYYDGMVCASIDLGSSVM